MEADKIINALAALITALTTAYTVWKGNLMRRSAREKTKEASDESQTQNADG